jgi:transcriptional regulator with XRE-family HTH domain
MYKYLGKLLADKRKEKGISKGQLAKNIGYSNISKGARKINELENGKMIEQVFNSITDSLNIPNDEIRQAIDRDKTEFDKWLNEPVHMKLVLRLMPAVYANQELPEDIKTEAQAKEYAERLAKRTKRKACLVLNRRWSYWISESGKGVMRETTFNYPVNYPYMYIA